MEENRGNLYRWIAYFGIAIWLIAHFTSSKVGEFNNTIQFFLGIMPNFGVVLFFPFILLSLGERIYKERDINEKRIFYISILIISILLIVDESINIIFKGLNFDLYNTIISSIAILLAIILFNIIIWKPKETK